MDLEKDLFSILTDLKQQIKNMSKIQDLSNDDKKIEEKKEILSKIEFIERCIKIGIIKKIDSMNHDELVSIALKSLSVITEDINPNEFISEYNELKRYISGYIESVAEKRKIIPDLIFTVKGPLDVLVDEKGNPRSDFKIIAEDQEKVMQLIKSKRKSIIVRLRVKVDSNYFKEEELAGMGYIKMSNNNYMNGFAIKTPDDYEMRLEARNTENPIQYFTISSDANASRKLESNYNIFEYKDCIEKIKKMEIILPEVQKKQKLLSDNSYLKEYVQKLLTNDPKFVDKYLADINTDTENKLLYEQDITTIPDEYMNMIIMNLSNISAENLKNMLDTPDKIDTYINIIESIKRKELKKIPVLHIVALDNSDKVMNLIKSKRGSLFRGINDVFGTARVAALPNFFTEDDLESLEKNNTINKIIDGENIQFKIDLTSYGIEIREQERLMQAFEEYRYLMNKQYPQVQAKIAEYDKKIIVLKNLKDQYKDLNIEETIPEDIPKH